MFRLCITKIRRTALPFLLIALTQTAAMQARAACGSEKIAIEGAGPNIVEVCRSIDEVAEYFANIGLSFPTEINIKISDKVLLNFYNPDGSGPPIEFQVSGYYDPAKNKIEITSPHSAASSDRRPWRLQWSPELAFSILKHELTHAAVHQNFKTAAKSISKPWMEFIAYAVQISLMDENLRKKVLASYPDAAPFETPERVNPFIYGYDPDAFGVRAYLFVRDKGGAQFIRKIITGQTGYDLQEIYWTK